MKLVRFWIAIYFTSLIAIGCGAPFYMTFNPPRGEHWDLTKDSFSNAAFEKPTLKGKNHIIFTYAKIVNNSHNIQNITDLLPFIEQDYQDIRRWKNIDLKPSIIYFNGNECVRVDFTAEDHGIPWAKTGNFYIQKGYDIYWLVLYNPYYLLVDAGYSQVFLPDDQPLEGIEEEIEPFLNSIVVHTEWGKRSP
jgi:hypothetical protein